MNGKRMPICRWPYLALPLALTLGACEGSIPPHLDPHSTPIGEVERAGNHDIGSILGSKGWDLLQLIDGDKDSESGGGAAIGVNAFLWRATLDVISFMPLASADPFGGVIITDWYTPQDTPNQRLKANVYIMGRELRADGLRVSVFRQGRADLESPWQDATVRPETNTKLEDRILSRARDLRAASRAAANR